MHKETLTYEDFDGNQRTEDFYFNLTEAELTEMEMSLNGGLSQLLEKIIKEDDRKEIIKYFKKIVLESYGVKSLDGRSFMKSEDIRNEFASTKAYSDIFMKFASDDVAASTFINNIIPKSRELKEVAKKADLPTLQSAT